MVKRVLSLESGDVFEDGPLSALSTNSFGSYFAIDESLKYAWPGNSLEVDNIVQASIIENKPPLISKFNFPIIYEDDTKAKSVSLLSPLEEGEKQVIQEYLRKNSYNKSRTMRDLEITINTLNAKMQRYGIRDIKRERKLEK